MTEKEISILTWSVMITFILTAAFLGIIFENTGYDKEEICRSYSQETGECVDSKKVQEIVDDWKED